MTIHTIQSDLRRYGFANVQGKRITGCKRSGFTLWRYVTVGNNHRVQEVVATFTTLEALLEAL